MTIVVYVCVRAAAGPLLVVVGYALLIVWGQLSVISWVLTLWFIGAFFIFLLVNILGGEVSYGRPFRNRSSHLVDILPAPSHPPDVCGGGRTESVGTHRRWASLATRCCRCSSPASCAFSSDPIGSFL
jgi:hypothetical protein